MSRAALRATCHSGYAPSPQVRSRPFGECQAQSLLPILREIDLRVGLDEALALRSIGRERRQERSRKGWRTRRTKGEN